MVEDIISSTFIIFMNKYLIRVCTNALLLFKKDIQVLGNDIDLLRDGHKSNISELNKLFDIHCKITNEKTRVSCDDLVRFYEDITEEQLSHEIKVELNFIYSKKDIEKIFIFIINNINSDKKLLLLELLFNAISFEQYKKLYLFRSSYFDGYDYIDHFAYEKMCNIINKESDYYLEKKRKVTVDEIKNNLEEVIKKNSFDPIKKVYLFGSYAKGTNDEFSDVDLLLVFDDETDAIVLCPIIKDILKEDYEIDSDIVPAIDGQLDEFDLHAVEYGILIYQNE